MLLIPGSGDPAPLAADAALAAAAQLAVRVQRMVPVCTGAFVLAATGCSTRPRDDALRDTAALQRRHPRVRGARLTDALDRYLSSNLRHVPRANAAQN